MANWDSLKEFRKTFKSVVDAYQKLVGSIAVTAALFAGVMISIAQMILSNGSQSTTWQALRILAYYSISANLIAAGSAIWAITYLAWLPLNSKIPHVDGDGEAQHKQATKLVRRNPGFMFQYYIAVIFYGLGLTLTLAVILGWVWLTMSHAEGIAMLVVVIPGFLCTSWPLFRALYIVVASPHKNPWMFDYPLDDGDDGVVGSTGEKVIASAPHR